MNVSTWLKACRAKRKLTLQALSDASGVTKSNIWEMENNEAAKPRLDTFVKLCVGLGVSPANEIKKITFED